MKRIEENEFPEKVIGKLILISRISDEKKLVADVVMVIGMQEGGRLAYQYKTGERAGKLFSSQYGFRTGLMVFEPEEMEQAIKEANEHNAEGDTI